MHKSFPVRRSGLVSGAPTGTALPRAEARRKPMNPSDRWRQSPVANCFKSPVLSSLAGSNLSGWLPQANLSRESGDQVRAGR